MLSMDSFTLRTSRSGKVRLVVLLVLLIASAAIVFLYNGTSYFNGAEPEGWEEDPEVLVGDDDVVEEVFSPPVPLVAGSAEATLNESEALVPVDEVPAADGESVVVASPDGDGESLPVETDAPTADLLWQYHPPMYTDVSTLAAIKPVQPEETVLLEAGNSFFRRNLAERWPEVLPAELIQWQAVQPARPGEVVVRLVPPIEGARVWLDDSHDLVSNRHGIVRIRNGMGGRGVLTVQATRFEPAIQQITLDPEGTDHTVELKPVYGWLEILTSPGAALVATADDDTVYDLGVAGEDGWIRVNDALQIGSYTVTLTAPNRHSVTQQIELPVGRIMRWYQPLEPFPGQLRVVTVPVGARVEILLPGGDFVPAGETPVTVEDIPAEVPVGVAVFLPGYVREMTALTLAPAETRVVSFGMLTAGAGDVELVVENEAFDAARAQVTVGEVSVWPKRQENTLLIEGLPAARQEVSIVHPDYLPHTIAVDVPDQQRVSRSLTLTPVPGELLLAVFGPSADQWQTAINGIEQKPQPWSTDGQSGYRRYLVPALENVEVSISALGWQTHALPLNLSRGERRILSVTLEPESQIKELSFATVNLPAGQRMEFVKIEPGEFLIGSDDNEKGRFADEGPRTKVRITRPFWMAKTPVTQAQWQAVMGTTLKALRDRGDAGWPIHGEGPTHPVYYVSWDEAMAFCRELTERERTAGRLPDGYYFTLPTEAQWEYAARAGSDRRWSFGDREDELSRFAWYSDNSGGTTHPVGLKEPNPWGLHDIHGNIWEWTRSWYGPYPGGEVVDYQGPSSGTTRVHRSSSWNASVDKTRSAYRDWLEPSERGYDLGFRVIIETPATPTTPQP